MLSGQLVQPRISPLQPHSESTTTFDFTFASSIHLAERTPATTTVKNSSPAHSKPLTTSQTAIMKARTLMLTPSRNALSQSSPLIRSFLRPAQHNALLLRTLTSSIRSPQSQAPTMRTPLIPPPAENSGPLLSRRANRALPSLTNTALWTWAKTLPLFVLAIVLSSLAIFNYQKSSSSTINSILYALRTNTQARELLGDEIYFASKTPWIRGELNQLHGRIDVRFWVKGTKGQGETRFKSERKRRDGYFETGEWSLVMTDGRKVELLDTKGGGEDIFRKK